MWPPQRESSVRSARPLPQSRRRARPRTAARTHWSRREKQCRDGSQCSDAACGWTRGGCPQPPKYDSTAQRDRNAASFDQGRVDSCARFDMPAAHCTGSAERFSSVMKGQILATGAGVRDSRRRATPIGQLAPSGSAKTPTPARSPWSARPRSGGACAASWWTRQGDRALPGPRRRGSRARRKVCLRLPSQRTVRHSGARLSYAPDRRWYQANLPSESDGARAPAPAHRGWQARGASPILTPPPLKPLSR